MFLTNGDVAGTQYQRVKLRYLLLGVWCSDVVKENRRSIWRLNDPLKYLDIVMTALNYSNLEQSDQMITLLNKIKDNDKLSTYHEKIIIKRDKFNKRY